MRYVLRGFFGAALMSAALALIGFSVGELLGVGTCASGGPYVVARECPDGTAALGLAIPAGVISLLIGAGVWAGRGKPPGSDRPAQNSALVLWVWTGLFWTIGGVCLATILGPEDPGPGGDLGAIIIIALFLPMGALGLLVFSPRADRAAAEYERRKTGIDPRTDPTVDRSARRVVVPLAVAVPAIALGVFAGLSLGAAIAPDPPEPDPATQAGADDPGSLFRAGPLAGRLAELGSSPVGSLEVTPSDLTTAPAGGGPGIDPSSIDPTAIERLAARVEAERLAASLSSLVRAEIGFRGGQPGWCLQFSVDPPTQYSGSLAGDRLVPMPGFC
ncbi:hypothetical protein HJD18_12940 [Thermoleophilia bacterium SCSIO 60948]|nr:hypothetical protein HJD18_12940 [Thermoleophilia bacterium SCSIO 60948]